MGENETMIERDTEREWEKERMKERKGMGGRE